MLMSAEANKRLFRDLFRVGSQIGKATGSKSSTSELQNLSRPVSNIKVNVG